MPSETRRHCVPCEGAVAPMTEAEAESRRPEIPDWTLCDGGRRIERRYGFKAFAPAFAFVSRIAAIAEAEGHHPDITFGWGYAVVSLQTHAVKGLHDNDFLMAGMIDEAFAG